MSEKQFSRGFVIWFTGLPGSGKSKAAAGAAEALRRRGYAVRLLCMDERRKVYFPNPVYSPEERREAYTLFADEGVAAAQRGEGVILDASAHRLEMRERARHSVDLFAEVHIRCEIEEAMRREENRPEGLVMAGLYRKALERKRTGKEFPGLGQVVGVDTPFEENEDAECVVDNTRLRREETLEQVMACLDALLSEWGVLEAGSSDK